MKIRSLTIRNLRAIDNVELRELGDFVLIAGPNGCGKTTVLDALRLIKSIYVQDEWKRWFNEFGINPDRPTNWRSCLRNPSAPAIVKAEIVLSESERAFLASAAQHIALAIALNGIPDRRGSATTVTGDPPILPPALPAHQLKEISASAAEFERSLRQEIQRSATFIAGLVITDAPSVEVDQSPIATAAFTCFNPDHLGEMEFHTSRRYYARESVENLRLKVTSRAEDRRSRFLYDLENKYKNIKTQLGEEYVTAVLRGQQPSAAPLQRSIKELFQTFFPGKEFLGVSIAPDNSLSFPVRVGTGEQHDIDELSSGEKEIVYGYLWLRTGTPRQSVILVDEPELHLNPALVQGLPNFYRTHLGDALDAQVWIVTHSDAILRQAVRSPTMSVFHMSRPEVGSPNQVRRIDGQDAVEAAVLDLIGDLAAYRPYARIVLIEGQRDTRFDVDVIRRLFPDLAEKANLIPVGSRSMTAGVRIRLLDVLEQTGLTGRAVSISDGDLGLGQKPQTGHFVWPVYEIENFLLEPSVLRQALVLLLRTDPYRSDDEVVEALRHLAEPLVSALSLDEAQHLLNRSFIEQLSIGGSSAKPLETLLRSAEASKNRIAALDVSEGYIRKLVDTAANRISESLKSRDFLRVLPGDRLMRAFAGSHHVSGDHFRNVCLEVAQRQGLRPEGMEEVLRKALK